jgi:hypothetical protein
MISQTYFKVTMIVKAHSMSDMTPITMLSVSCPPSVAAVKLSLSA